ncbi:MAG: phosphoribosylamine--glycine ligase [Candidatus Micrarchaeota archaeon]|nr:phosphoribosylamine--glycine ligase [Candidatus Micrarchaeota archaeon]
MRNFLLVANAAREHAIAKAILKTKNVRLFCFANALNPAIKELCLKSGGEYKIGNIEDGVAIAEWAVEKNIDLAFPSPDAVLAAGVVDELEKNKILCAAPTKKAAKIEWDKNFLRSLMSKYSIKGYPKFKHFFSEEQIDDFIDSLGGSVAIKPCGLTGGKGVKVVGFQLKDAAEAKNYAREVLKDKIGGELGVLVEEKLEGEEFSLMAFTDSNTVIGMPMVQDHKRAYEGDLGPNTGGMGSYSHSSFVLPFLKKSDYIQAMEILKKIIEALKKESIEYKGIIYGGFIATKNGVYCIETNSRFGDPEVMNVLAVLKTPLFEILDSIATKTLSRKKISWEKKATVVKYLVPKGYPQKAIDPSPITIDWNKLKEVELFFGSVEEKNGVLYTSKSRAIALLAKAETIEQASQKIENSISSIQGPLWYRKDIGSKELLEKRFQHMKEIRKK